MTEHSSQHAYVTWAKQRLDEMDAALASFEANASQLKADAKLKATKLNDEMEKRRKDFEAEVKTHADSGEAALKASKAQLEKQWTSFEAELKSYVETVGKDIDQKRATFAGIAVAQVKAWGAAAEKLQSAAAKLGAENRAKADKAIAQLRQNATEAKDHFDKLRQAGDASWSTLSAALQASRKQFDEASQKAWDAFKNANK